MMTTSLRSSTDDVQRRAPASVTIQATNSRCECHMDNEEWLERHNARVAFLGVCTNIKTAHPRTRTCTNWVAIRECYSGGSGEDGECPHCINEAIERDHR